MGERWALLVVRELLLGPKRFTDLRSGLPHLSPDVLANACAAREAGVGRPPHARTAGRLPRVRAHRPRPRTQAVILALGRWGSVAPFPEEDAGVGTDAAVIALKTLFDPASPPASNPL